MNSKIAITAIALVVVIMGMSAIAPVLAVTPPARSPGDAEVPKIDCGELADALDDAGVSAVAKAQILKLAGC